MAEVDITALKVSAIAITEMVNELVSAGMRRKDALYFTAVMASTIASKDADDEEA
jgi:hypothetical protein